MNESAAREKASIRYAGAAGMLGVAMGTVAAIVGMMWDLPDTGASAAEIAANLSEDRGLGLAMMLVNTIVLTLWLIFGAGVWVRLRELDRPDSVLLACFALGFSVFIALLFAGFAMFFVLLYRSADVGDPRMLYDLTFGLLALSGAPTALALTAYAELVFRSGQLSRRTAHLAVLGAVAHVVLLGSFLVSSGFFSLEGEVIMAIPATLFAWIFGTGLVLFREPDRVR